MHPLRALHAPGLWEHPLGEKTMTALKLGIRLESLGLPLRRALVEAARLGVSGVQLDAVGELAPQQLSATGRRELLYLLRSHNVELTAIGCPLRFGLDVAEHQQQRIEYVQEALSLSYDLGPRRVVVASGRLPAPEDVARTALLTDALTALGRHGDRSGTILALETGLDSGAALRDFLARFDTAGLGVNLDPANLVMNGFDPYQAARDVAGRVVHVHAKDARGSTANRLAQEVPLGHGDLDWLSFLGTLVEIAYSGWLVVERESGNDPRSDVVAGVAFLRNLMG
jgi:L-ribulose-5-phosphate 3-epimerase